MYSTDWISHNLDNWQRWFAHLAGRPYLRMLEIGSYEGRSTRWWLDNLLTGEGASIFCIDAFEGSPEYHPLDQTTVLGRFLVNVGYFSHGERVTVRVQPSWKALGELLASGDPGYDLIYVDGSHDHHDVLLDAALAWRLLRPGGYLLFDDYPWEHTFSDGRTIGPARAIDAFLAVYGDELTVVAQEWQVLVRRGLPKAST